MAEFDAPQSRNEAILQNMLGANNVIGEPESRIEALLIQILEQGGISGEKFNELAREEWVYNKVIPDGDMIVYPGKNISSRNNMIDNPAYTCISFVVPVDGYYQVSPSTTSQLQFCVYDEGTFTAEHFVRRVAPTEGMSGTQLSAGEVFVVCAFSTTLSVTVAYATEPIVTLNPELPLTQEQRLEMSEYIKVLSDELLDDGYTDLNGEWALNGWNSYSSKDNRTFRVRYTEPVMFDRDVFILADVGFRVAAYYEAGGSTSATTIIRLPKGTCAHIYIRRANEDYSEVANVAEFAAACHISSCVADIERFRHTFTDVSMFVRMGVCGDSYANGGGIISGIRPLTWGKNIERQTGVTVDIYARSGQTVVQWVDDQDRGLPALLAGAECGLYWLQHGINGTNTPELLGTPADMSADPKPATFYGKYAEAVQRIQEQFPNARIVLATIIGSTSGLYDTQYLAVNEAIKTIAQFCAVPCVDVIADDFYKSLWYKDGIRSNHPTAMIAAGMAVANCRLISRCIQEYPDYFVNYGSAGYSVIGKGLSTNDYTDEDKAKVDSIVLLGDAVVAGGVILTSLNGTKYRLTVADDGTLTTTAV